ncbi:MAG: aminoacyl-tRNA hydrolase [Alphaproteobacteria bacterium]|nr:aminoacyl-tRNA hydrolase [Alphaproteobacteria bacterium]
MLLIVGIGNPGQKYAHNRHNVGFIIVDEIAKHYVISDFRQRFHALCAESHILNHKILLLKPLTYVNESGRSIQDIAHFYKLSGDQIFVIYDDLDLELGRIKIKKGGSAGGHNGIRSIDNHFGIDYWRIRIGIGHPGHRGLVKNYVLQDFTKAEEEVIASLSKIFIKHLELLLKKDMNKLMTAISLDMK